MQRQWKRYASTLTLVLLAAFALTPSARVKADDDGARVVGTWILTATLDTPPGAPPVVENEFVTFNPGGTVNLTSTIFNAHAAGNPFLPPFLTVNISDGYGSWRTQEESDQVAVTFKRWLFAGANTPKSLYPSIFVGQFVGEATIQATGAVQHTEAGDTLTFRFTFQGRNLSGLVTGAGSGTASAVRLKIEPLTP